MIPTCFIPPRPVRTGIEEHIDLGLVDEFKMVTGAYPQAGQSHHDRSAHAGEGGL